MNRGGSIDEASGGLGRRYWRNDGGEPYSQGTGQRGRNGPGPDPAGRSGGDPRLPTRLPDGRLRQDAAGGDPPGREPASPPIDPAREGRDREGRPRREEGPTERGQGDPLRYPRDLERIRDPPRAHSRVRRGGAQLL